VFQSRALTDQAFPHTFMGCRGDPHDLRGTHRTSVPAQVEIVAAMLEAKLPAVADMLRQAREQITVRRPSRSRLAQSAEHNPLERLSREVKGCTDVVGSFPNPTALHRISSHVLIEAHDKWQVSDRR
jgi:putative transposase